MGEFVGSGSSCLVEESQSGLWREWVMKGEKWC
jgi:hypothetical protein